MLCRVLGDLLINLDIIFACLCFRKHKCSVFDQKKVNMLVFSSLIIQQVLQKIKIVVRILSQAAVIISIV